MDIKKIIREEINTTLDSFYLIVSRGESFVWSKSNLGGWGMTPIEELDTEDIVRSRFNHFDEAQDIIDRFSKYHRENILRYEPKVITVDFLMRKRDEEFPIIESEQFNWIEDIPNVNPKTRPRVGYIYRWQEYPTMLDFVESDIIEVKKIYREGPPTEHGLRNPYDDFYIQFTTVPDPYPRDFDEMFLLDFIKGIDDGDIVFIGDSVSSLNESMAGNSKVFKLIREGLTEGEDLSWIQDVSSEIPRHSNRRKVKFSELFDSIIREDSADSEELLEYLEEHGLIERDEEWEEDPDTERTTEQTGRLYKWVEEPDMTLWEHREWLEYLNNDEWKYVTQTTQDYELEYSSSRELVLFERKKDKSYFGYEYNWYYHDGPEDADEELTEYFQRKVTITEWV